MSQLKPLKPPAQPELVTQDVLFSARQQALSLYMAEAVEEYIVQLIMATRKPRAIQSRN